MQEIINYIELSTSSINKTKVFFAEVFNWKFTDYSEKYIAYEVGEVHVGFYEVKSFKASNEGALIVFYSDDLASTNDKVIKAGGEIVKNESFPGGKRFQFLDTTGNKYAVWTRI